MAFFFFVHKLNSAFQVEGMRGMPAEINKLLLYETPQHFIKHLITHLLMLFLSLAHVGSSVWGGGSSFGAIVAL